jgi:hypothetical protein
MRRLAWALTITFPAAAMAQTMPSSITRTGTYTAASLGLTTGAGGIEFNAAGTTLYVNDPYADRVMAATVVRNASGRITGFASPVVLVSSLSSPAGALDGGCSLDSAGTFFLSNWNTAELEQYSPVTKAHTVTLLKPLGIPGSTGGAEYFARNASLLVSDYDTGGIYELPLTRGANLVYTLGSATRYLTTPTGVEGFEFVRGGAFDNGRGLLLVNYDAKTISLVPLSVQTGKPLANASGVPYSLPFMTGLNEPMDVEFDPVTNDLFVSDYNSATAVLLQFSGEVLGGLDGPFHIYGPGCPKQGGGVPTLDTQSNPVRVNVPVMFRLTNAPPSEPVTVLLFGFGNAGNLGGIVLTGTTCMAHVNPLLHVPFATDAAGMASLTVTLPAIGLGVPLFTQVAALSRGANAANLTLSDAGTSLIAR